MPSETTFAQKIFEAAQIDKIVWIDDHFSEEPALDIEAANVIHAIEIDVDRQDIDKYQSNPVFTELGIDLSLNRELWIDNLTKAVSESKELTLSLSKLVEASDLDHSVTEISSYFENRISVEKHSYASWKQYRSELLKDAEKTLFLIDLYFTKEGHKGKVGIDILEDLLDQQSIGGCVVCTSSVKNNDEEEKERSEIVKTLTLPKNKKIGHYLFSVLSKDTLNPTLPSEDIEGSIPNVMLHLFIKKVCGNIANDLNDQISQSLAEAFEDIANQNIYALDQAIFQNSLKEGASEFDVMFRVLQLSQKSAVCDVLQNNQNLIEQLKKLRNLNQTDHFIKDRKLSHAFVELRKSEYWDTDREINSISSPLSNGDIFQDTSRPSKQYVLLAQPCDLSVRGDGNRSPYDGILVPFEKRDFSTKENGIQKAKEDRAKINEFAATHLIDDVTDDLLHYKIDFRKAINVNLSVLDWCVYNADGTVSLKTEPECNTLLHLPGWQKKFNTLKSDITDLSDNILPEELCILSNNYKPLLNPKYNYNPVYQEDNGIWVTGLRRVLRLRDPYAEHLLSSYFAFKSRRAFTHDFTQEAI